jgi:basic amino acid/polyamine antiporter, APA family
MATGNAADAAESTGASGPGFVKAMTLTDATMLVAGTMIGSGIFIVSADMSRTLGSPFWLLIAWVLTGIMTLLGALAYGELAAMYPRAGGQYVFLREAMGPLMGFLYGWTLFVVIQTGTIAAVGVAFGRFLGVLWPAIGPDRFAWFPRFDVRTAGGVIELGLTPQRLVALVSIWILTWVNLRGVREGKFVQTTLSIVKAGALAALIVLGLTIGRNAEAVAANFGSGFFGAGGGIFPGGGFTGAFVLAFGAAMVGSLFSSDSWHGVTSTAAEVKDATRILPQSLLYGTGLVTLLYVAANLSYLSVLPFDAIQTAAEDRVGTAVAEGIFGASGATLMAIAILVSTFGCNNGLILAGARVYWAMARDGLFFRPAATLSSTGVPAWALVAQAVWTSVLCLTGTYGQLLDYVIFAALVFYALTTAGLFVLRVKRPEVHRPYRAIGYPVLPALYILLATAVAAILLVADKTRAQALSGLVVVLLGVPVYFLTGRSGASAGR